MVRKERPSDIGVLAAVYKDFVKRSREISSTSAGSSWSRREAPTRPGPIAASGSNGVYKSGRKSLAGTRLSLVKDYYSRRYLNRIRADEIRWKF